MYQHNPHIYGTNNSQLLQEIKTAGFNPIAITVMMCEETFVFKGKAEAMRAWEIFRPEGWWYDLGEFIETRKQYVKDAYGGNVDKAPTVYWLNTNYITEI